jgi:serine/threonine protein kinase
VATALDHAYNTTIDDDRTLHGLVWPAFIAVSDDGEIRLGGFGLAPGVLPSLGKPRIAREVAPYLAPEERERAAAGRSSDVYSVGAISTPSFFCGLPRVNFSAAKASRASATRSGVISASGLSDPK